MKPPSLTRRMRLMGCVAWSVALCCAALPAAAGEIKRVAGSYYEGDGLGLNWTLTIGAKGTFAFTWDGCLGRYDENKGDAAVEDGVVKLHPKMPRDNGTRKQLPLEWVPVAWGERMYLIEDDDIPLFAKYVNQGWEPRTGPHGLFLLRDNDWKKEAPGTPDLPEKWSGLLLAQPVEAGVVRVLDGARAEIDKGSGSGLRAGMLLTAVDGREWLDVTVRSVDQDKAVIEAMPGHELTARHRVTSRTP